jgi:ABC-2 type transport system permease protein
MMKQYTELLTSMGWAVQMFGGGDAVFTASPAGMVAFGLFSYTILLLAGYGVVAGLAITANEEDRGILDVLLSAPVPRWKLVVEKLLAYLVVVVIAIAITGVANVLLVQSSSTLGDVSQGGASVGRVIEGTLNLLPSTLLVIAFTALVAVLVRRRNTAALIGALFVIGSYLVDIIARTAQAGEGIRALSFIQYYDATAAMRDGLVWVNVFSLLAVAALMAAGAVYFFQRRDVGV